MNEPRPERLRTFGRIRGRTLRPGRAQLMEELLPQLSLDLEHGRLDPKALAPRAKQTWVELGFGAGEHLARQAETHPQTLILGAEPFINGAASALRHIRDLRLSNVRIHAGDGRELLAAMPDGTADRVYILFPDPWPKARHHKRRLINPDVVAELARVLKPGGLVRFATDWADYVGWTLERFAASPAFEWTAERAADWTSPPPDHVQTRYQMKRLGDCEPVFLEFRRLPA
jgi:tRNA (guanine-N7-)-methyltransferase